MVIKARAQNIELTPGMKINLVFATGFLGYLNLEDITEFFKKMMGAKIPMMLLRESINQPGDPDRIDKPQQYMVRQASSYHNLVTEFEGADLVRSETREFR